MHLVSPYDRAWRERQLRALASRQPQRPCPKQALRRRLQAHGLALICGFSAGFALASFLPPLASPRAYSLERHHPADSSGLPAGPFRAQP